MNDSIEVVATKGAKNPMDGLIWVAGFVLLYFAMQLWILPKLGIST